MGVVSSFEFRNCRCRNSQSKNRKKIAAEVLEFRPGRPGWLDWVVGSKEVSDGALTSFTRGDLLLTGIVSSTLVEAG
jgi:hypothetical protein